jgi:hypothetical protein
MSSGVVTWGMQQRICMGEIPIAGIGAVSGGLSGCNPVKLRSSRLIMSTGETKRNKTKKM